MGEVKIYSSSSAKDYYQAGCQFKEAAVRCFSDGDGNIMKDGHMIQLPAPTVVNGAFACEMFLKALLRWENVSFKHTHELSALFDSLSAQTQEGISRFCMPKVSVGYRDRFRTILEKYKRVFIDDRYYAENTGWQDLSPLALVNLAQNLGTITGVYIN